MFVLRCSRLLSSGSTDKPDMSFAQNRMWSIKKSFCGHELTSHPEDADSSAKNTASPLGPCYCLESRFGG